MFGFVGKKHVGKDTACDYFVSKYGFEKHSFAHPLKICAQYLFNFSDNQLHTENKDEIDSKWNIKPRTVFQQFGSLVKSLAGDDYFLKRMELNFDTCKSIVISDVRFQNEIDYIKSKGGIIVKIERPELTNIDLHESETSVDSVTGIDFHVINRGGLEDFYAKLDTLVLNI